MVSASAQRLWACRHFTIQKWATTELRRTEFHASFDSIGWPALQGWPETNAVEADAGQ